MPPHRRSLAAIAFLMMVCAGPVDADAWELSGTKQISLQTRDGAAIAIGTVTFSPEGEGANFSLDLDRKAFADFFLSMREFKCVEGPEVQCHVPYPYDNPHHVTRSDLAWLEHSLIFFFKTPSEYGAKLGNGLYYAMRITHEGIVGTPEAIDLDDIAAPPADAALPPFDPERRSEIQSDARWIERVLIR